MPGNPGPGSPPTPTCIQQALSAASLRSRRVTHCPIGASQLDVGGPGQRIPSVPCPGTRPAVDSGVEGHRVELFHGAEVRELCPEKSLGPTFLLTGGGGVRCGQKSLRMGTGQAPIGTSLAAPLHEFPRTMSPSPLPSAPLPDLTPTIPASFLPEMCPELLPQLGPHLGENTEA